MLAGKLRQDAAGVFKEDRDLPSLIAATATRYETSSHLLGADLKTADKGAAILE